MDDLRWSPDENEVCPVRVNPALREGERAFENEWDFWLLPTQVAWPSRAALYGEPARTWLTSVTAHPL